MHSSFQTLVDNHPKMQQLNHIIKPLLTDGLMIAFSGGVDSSFLLWSANEIRKQWGLKEETLTAILTVSPSVPEWEIADAKKMAEDFKVPLHVVPSHELNQEAYRKNEGDRCYYCKAELFSIAKDLAQKLGMKNIAYGYNASDRQDVRHGQRAAEENNIHAPLEAAGLEKNDIRLLLRQIGLALADKPASPCLASRIMTGVTVTEERLTHVKLMEDILRSFGIKIYRVRIHEESVKSTNIINRYFRIEVSPDEMPLILALREKLMNQAKQLGYRWVNLDLAGYTMGGATS